MKKDCLVYENNRNKISHDLFTSLIDIAFDPEEVVIGHHLAYVKDGSEEEIPSADTFLFDHDCMRTIFGEQAYRDVMVELALTDPDSREEKLRAMCLVHGIPIKGVSK